MCVLNILYYFTVEKFDKKSRLFNKMSFNKLTYECDKTFVYYFM